MLRAGSCAEGGSTSASSRGGTVQHLAHSDHCERARMRRKKSARNIMEPIADRQDEEVTIFRYDFADWREFRRKRWTERKFDKNLRMPWRS